MISVLALIRGASGQDQQLFLDAVAKREALVRTRGFRVLEAAWGPNGLFHLQLVQAGFRGRREHWRRRGVTSDNAGAALRHLGLSRLRGLSERKRQIGEAFDSICSLLQGSLRPSIGISDGARALFLSPADSKQPHLWSGTLKRNVGDLRMGGVRCGLMWSEKWLSHVLSTLEYVGSTELGGFRILVWAHEGRTFNRFHLIKCTPESGWLPLRHGVIYDSQLTVPEVRQRLFKQVGLWSNNNGWVATVDAFRSIGDVTLPVAGSFRSDLAPKDSHGAWFRYDALADEPWGFDLDSAPPFLSGSDIQVSDELTEESWVWDASGRRRLGDAPAVPSAPHREFSWTPLAVAVIAFAILGALAARVFLKRNG